MLFSLDLASFEAVGIVSGCGKSKIDFPGSLVSTKFGTELSSCSDMICGGFSRRSGEGTAEEEGSLPVERKSAG